MDTLDKASPRLPWLLENMRLKTELKRAYNARWDSYHNLLHLEEMFKALEQLKNNGAIYDETTLNLAIWFHDSVYEGLPTDEEKSAQWAEESLKKLVNNDVRQEVARLIRLTHSHEADTQDIQGQLLCDVDLAILAKPENRYREYADGVRKEYSHVEDTAFAQGRSEILKSFLKGHIYHTPVAQALWEAQARVNIEKEIEELSLFLK